MEEEEEEGKERKMVELGKGGNSLVSFSPEALVDERDTMEALEMNLASLLSSIDASCMERLLTPPSLLFILNDFRQLPNIRLLSDSWSLRMLPEVIAHLQDHAGVRDGEEK